MMRKCLAARVRVPGGVKAVKDIRVGDVVLDVRDATVMMKSQADAVSSDDELGHIVASGDRRKHVIPDSKGESQRASDGEGQAVAPLTAADLDGVTEEFPIARQLDGELTRPHMHNNAVKPLFTFDIWTGFRKGESKHVKHGKEVLLAHFLSQRPRKFDRQHLDLSLARNATYGTVQVKAINNHLGSNRAAWILAAARQSQEPLMLLCQRLGTAGFLPAPLPQLTPVYLYPPDVALQVIKADDGLRECERP